MPIEAHSIQETCRSGRCKNYWNKFPITVEPIIFAIFFLYSLTDAVSTNVLITKTCTVVYNFSEAECIGKLEPEVEGMVQSYTTQITMIKIILESVVSGLISMFVGFWSDINGRKPFIIIPTAGFALYYISWFIFINLPYVSPLWVLVPSMCSSLAGGVASIFICVFCYVTDITHENNRAFRMAAVYSTLTLGVISGYLTSSYVYECYGHSAIMIIFSVASGSSIIALLYATILLPESKQPAQDASGSFFNLKNLKETCITVFMPRPQKRTLITLMEALIIVIGTTIFNGEIAFKYYALRKSFGWGLEQYNLYSGTLAGVSVIASTIGSYISCSVLHVHDLYIALFVALTATVSCILLALSRTAIEFYLFSVVGCFGLLLNPMLKTQISRTVEPSSLGKYFAFVSTLEAFVPLFTSPLYRSVYNALLDTQPLHYLFLSAGLWSFISVLVMSVLIIKSFFARDYDQLLINGDPDEPNPGSSGVEVPQE
ncbi:probable peptidoglycan muropeptide transporter SLC46 [Halyomorpha halys]|uniref:probable peptidoglycan muropeptide transporter SLC46 n=1 Tax=Halyomorpha halys TaxID=286706 RepID=UPI0006D50934|nr:proton-coupled folate transporter [Halyomorpha halys]